MSADDVVGLVVGAILVGYLFVAILFPERF
jgi:K+-transporting ATPase KdpF subunit